MFEMSYDTNHTKRVVTHLSAFSRYNNIIMSRWLRNVNALLENLDNQVEETVEEHRFNRTITEAARKSGSSNDIDGIGGVDAVAAAVEGLLQEEAQGVDDILAKRGLLGGGSGDDDDEEEEEDVGGTNNDDDAPGDNENLAEENGSALNETVYEDASENELQSPPGTVSKSNKKSDEDKGASEVDAEAGFTDESGDAGKSNVGESFGNNNIDEKKEIMATSSSVDEVVLSSDNQPHDVGGNTKTPSSSNLAALRNLGGIIPSSPAAPLLNKNATVVATDGGASLKELRKLRRHVLQLNSDLESAEREIEAQRQELDRAASRMERDRSRHKQEKEASDASHKAEIVALTASQERIIRQLKDTNDMALREMESRVSRAEQQRAKEGGERDADLADALERERLAVMAASRLQEEMTTLNERIESLTGETSRLDTRLENVTSQMELASERERNAEEQLDKALSLHARQLGVRQKRESELERTVTDLAAALVQAKNKIEASMKAEINLLDGGNASQGACNNPDEEENLLDLKDEIENLRAQVMLERRRCATLHEELQDLSKEQTDELSMAHSKQREYERTISDLTTTITKLKMNLAMPQDIGDDENAMDFISSSSGGQHSGDDKKETDHLRKQIISLSEKIVEQQSRIDSGRGEISTMKNRLQSALVRAETAEKSLEGANQRLIMMDIPASSGMSSADEELGLPVRRKRRSGFHKTSKVESIRSALGLHPGRFPSGGWQEMISSLLDTFDTLSVDLGSHFRHYPMSRLAFMMYLLVLHTWTFFLLVYHAHAQGGVGGEHGPEAMMRSYHYMEQAPQLMTASIPKVTN
jgi:hypothetical protein